jgi:broad specificity phosphatase PhoE
MEITRFHLIRHALVEPAARAVLYGDMDVSLCAATLREEALVERLRAPAHPFWPHAADERPPGGESLADVRARVAPVMDRLCEAHAGQDVVIVAHGGSIRAVLSHALNLSAQQALTFSIKNLSLTRIERHGPDWRIVGVNEEPWVLADDTQSGPG